MNETTTVILKGELHSSHADLAEEKSLLTDDVDVLVLEQSQSSAAFRLLDGWFLLSVSLLTWILESLYHPMDVLVDLASVQGIEVVYTRPDDVVPLAETSLPMKAMAACLFYTLVPGSLWIGFVTRNHFVGSLLLFLGLVLPVVLVRLYNTNRPDRAGNRDERIAQRIASAARPGDVVVAIVGAGHLHEVERRLPDHVEVAVRPPVYDVWSARHVKNVGLPAVKAGFVLFSLYVLSVWIVVQVVGYVSPVVVAVLG